MLSSGALGFILLIVLHPGLGIDNLQNIINHLRNKYGFNNNQYALGINVAAKYCNQSAVLDWNFLPNDDAMKVKHKMAVKDRIYRGVRLIGARPKLSPDQKFNYHSEYLLLKHSMSNTLACFDPLMKTLLDSDYSGCTVFFTLNSPCVNTCSESRGTYSIIPALKMFGNHNAKAFVFNRVWVRDLIPKRNWQKNIKLINNIIPVFRCDANGCTRCVENGKVNPRCIKN